MLVHAVKTKMSVHAGGLKSRVHAATASARVCWGAKMLKPQGLRGRPKCQNVGACRDNENVRMLGRAGIAKMSECSAEIVL